MSTPTEKEPQFDTTTSESLENKPITSTIPPDIENQNTPSAPTKTDSVLKSLSFLDRFLALWILLAMGLGIILGYFVPGTQNVLNTAQFIGVSAPIAVGLIIMMYPILCKVRFEELHRAFSEKSLWIQIGFSLVVNWIVAPLVMVGLAWAFLPDKESFRQGLILVGLARCIAMVLIWNDLAGGDGDYCAILVAVNSLLQIVLYAPLAVFYLNVVRQPKPPGEQAVTVSYTVVAKSVAVFLGIPLLAAVITRLVLRRLLGPKKYQSYFIRPIAPLSLIGLLFTIIILFASQGRAVVNQIILVVRVSAPLLVYFIIMFFSTIFICRRFGFDYGNISVQGFTAASNNFELAIAVAVATFGVGSDQALAATVGPLIEVPVLVGLVYVLKWWSRRGGWGKQSE